MEEPGPLEKPISSPVNFDGKPHPLPNGPTITWKQIDPNTFERTSVLDGKVLNTRHLVISDSGRTLTEETKTNYPNGKSGTLKVVYERASGEPSGGLVGTWRFKSRQADTPTEVKYERARKMPKRSRMRLAQATTMLDGKPVLSSGGRSIPNIMAFAKVINDRTRETTMIREGHLFSRTIATVSADGKTLTITTTNLERKDAPPSIVVYEKR